MALINRMSSRQMGTGNMKRALARLSLEWDGLLQAVPPDASNDFVRQARDKLFELVKDTAFLWGTSRAGRRAARSAAPPLVVLSTDPPLIVIGTPAALLPWLYDPADFSGFTPAQIRAGLTVPACVP